MDGALLGPQSMWKASGHVDNFHDPLIDCKACETRYRADEVNLEKACARCGKCNWGEIKEFHMMFSTQVGAQVESSSQAYLRPETAQNIFVQFKNIISTNRIKLPFGVMQMGKAFRNEITPRQFLFRMREFSQMEMEFFCDEAKAEELFSFWVDHRKKFYLMLGLNDTQFQVRYHEKSELAHYSKATADIEYHFPFGWKELEGVAYRTNYDLAQHSACSGKDLGLFNDELQQTKVPHVIECSVGIERLMFALFCAFYDEEVLDGEKRVVMRFPVHIAPIKAAVFPLTKHEEEMAQKLFYELCITGMEVEYDASGSIGKRYRRQDEIGTPYCITIDSESRTHNKVTIRHRDTMQQEYVAVDEVASFLRRNNPCG